MPMHMSMIDVGKDFLYLNKNGRVSKGYTVLTGK